MAEIRVTDEKAVAAIWAAAGGEGEAPAALTVRVSKADAGPVFCACGCGTETAGGTWAPGHDAKHKSALYGRVRNGTAKDKAAALAEIGERGWPTPAEPKAKAKKESPKPKAKATATSKAKADAREAAADAE